MVDISRIDLNLLVALDALLAERNVSRAALRLGLSQSALSTQLGRLRRVFGDPLLLRTSRGMLPTARALELAPPLRRLIGEMERLVQPTQPFDATEADRVFTIAASDYVEFAVLPSLVEYLSEHAPRARLVVRPMDFELLARQLERGDVDLTIISTQFAPQDMRMRALYEERFVCVVRDGHPRIRETLTIDDFCAVRHVLTVPSSGGLVSPLDDVLAAQGRSRHIALSVPHFLLTLELVARSDLMAVLPERLARGSMHRLRILPPPFEVPTVTIAEVWHERLHREPANAWLRQVVAELMESPDPTAAAVSARAVPARGPRPGPAPRSLRTSRRRA